MVNNVTYNVKNLKQEHFEATLADEKCLKSLIEHNNGVIFHIFLKESEEGE